MTATPPAAASRQFPEATSQGHINTDRLILDPARYGRIVIEEQQALRQATLQGLDRESPLAAQVQDDIDQLKSLVAHLASGAAPAAGDLTTGIPAKPRWFVVEAGLIAGLFIAASYLVLATCQVLGVVLPADPTDPSGSLITALVLALVAAALGWTSSWRRSLIASGILLAWAISHLAFAVVAIFASFRLGQAQLTGFPFVLATVFSFDALVLAWKTRRARKSGLARPASPDRWGVEAWASRHPAAPALGFVACIVLYAAPYVLTPSNHPTASTERQAPDSASAGTATVAPVAAPPALAPGTEPSAVSSPLVAAALGSSAERPAGDQTVTLTATSVVQLGDDLDAVILVGPPACSACSSLAGVAYVHHDVSGYAKQGEWLFPMIGNELEEPPQASESQTADEARVTFRAGSSADGCTFTQLVVVSLEHDQARLISQNKGSSPASCR